MSFEYSDAALQAYFVKECLHMTNAQCWKQLQTPFDLAEKAEERGEELAALAEEFRREPAVAGADGMICPFDEDFPALNPRVPLGDRPFLLFYRGSRRNLSLLAERDRSVAVIGAVDPDEETEARERSLVEALVEGGLTVVSGLAKGCDTIAHQTCLERGGRTIAVLPTSLGKIYPAGNRALAEQIAGEGGLLLTEYAAEADSRYASLKRFTERDRLQALFCKAVILVASHRRNEGDSGSRYAMESAKKYGIGRYVMFNRERDGGKSLFGLNEDLQREPGVQVIRPSVIAELTSEREDGLEEEKFQQITLDLGAV